MTTRRPALPPPVIRSDGIRWWVRRAWPPGSDGGPMPVELVADPADRRVRAGWWQDDRLDLLPYRTDPRLPALADHLGPGPTRSTVVSHRPGKRAVVRTGTGSYVKVVRPGRAARVVQGIERSAPLATAFRMPTVLAADDATVTFAELPGRSLHDPTGWSLADWTRAWRAVVTAWASATGTPTGTGIVVDPAVPHHGPADEAAVLRGWAAAATGAGALPVGLLWPAIEATCGDLTAGPASPTRTIHRDLHDGQLVWHPGLGPGLLDVDTACRGEGALDLGNLRAHARWRCWQGIWRPEHTAAVLTASDAAAATSPLLRTRVAIHERAALLRVCCVHAFRPADRTAARALLHRVVRGSQLTPAADPAASPVPAH